MRLLAGKSFVKRSALLRGFILLALSLVASYIPGCGGASTDQIQILRSEIFTLKQEQRQLGHQVSTLDSLLTQRLGGFDQFGAGFVTDIRQMKERLSIAEQRIIDLEARLLRLQSASVTSPASASAETAPAGKKQAERIDPREIFDLARKDFTVGNYKMAIEGFRDFLQRFPDNPLAPEAYLNIGNGYRALKKYEEAISNYRVIVDRFPDSPHHPDALFKIGDCLIKLGDKSRGETYFQTLIQKFPDSDAAALARARLNP
jgi:tol-pal system protein YbgF